MKVYQFKESPKRNLCMENNETIFSEMETSEVEVTLLQGFLIRLFDFAIDILLLYIFYLLVPRELFLKLTGSSSLLIFVMVLLVVTIYRFLFLMLFNKTIGMMICRAKLLNKKLLPLSPVEKLVSIFRTRFSPIKYYKDK